MSHQLADQSVSTKGEIWTLFDPNNPDRNYPFNPQDPANNGLGEPEDILDWWRTFRQLDDRERVALAGTLEAIWHETNSPTWDLKDAVEDTSPPDWGYYLLEEGHLSPESRFYVGGYWGTKDAPELNNVGAGLLWVARLPQYLAYVNGAFFHDDDASRVPHVWTLEEALRWITPPEVWDAVQDGRQVLRHGDVYVVESYGPNRIITGTTALPDGHKLIAERDYLGNYIGPATLEHSEHGILSWDFASHIVTQPRDKDHQNRYDSGARSGYATDSAGGGWD